MSNVEQEFRIPQLQYIYVNMYEFNIPQLENNVKSASTGHCGEPGKYFFILEKMTSVFRHDGEPHKGSLENLNTIVCCDVREF